MFQHDQKVNVIALPKSAWVNSVFIYDLENITFVFLLDGSYEAAVWGKR